MAGNPGIAVILVIALTPIARTVRIMIGYCMAVCGNAIVMGGVGI
jgi:hypothetical protein